MANNKTYINNLDIGLMTKEITYSEVQAGFFFSCAQCKSSINGGEIMYLPLEHTDENALTIHRAICIKCYEKNKMEVENV